MRRRTQSLIWATLCIVLLPRPAMAVDVTVAWDPPTTYTNGDPLDPTELTGYKLYYANHAAGTREEFDGNFAQEGPSPIDVPLGALNNPTDPAHPVFTIHNVPSCTHIYLAATAYILSPPDPVQESDFSNFADKTVMTKPTSVAATPGTQAGTLLVSWTGLLAGDSGSISGFRVNYDVDQGTPYQGTGATQGSSPVQVGATATSLLLTGLTGGVTLYVTVESTCPDGAGNPSDETSGVVAGGAVCGNNTVETGETCDPPLSCPTACDDGNSCTVDALTGSAATCSVTCSHNPITACKSGDGCCPAGCDSTTDGDCSASCGNGKVEAGETCDPSSSCPTTCDDGNACTVDVLTGSAASCSAACSHAPTTACKSSDGCCPPGCNSTSDGDCSATCGNGQVDSGETCDPPSSCPASCDDGNACTMDTLTGSAASCSASCSHAPISACKSGDGCCPPGCDHATDSDCSATCGNGQVDSGETCDPPSSCPTTCDDGNACTVDVLTGSAASCSAACSRSAITACKSGDGCCPAGCDSATDKDCASGGAHGASSPGEAQTLVGGACAIDPATGATETAAPLALAFFAALLLLRGRRRSRR